jgi:alpha-galactosidase
MSPTSQLDDGWCSGRDASGALLADPKLFPNGMKAVADYVHSKGLKFGIYTARGSTTCLGRPGADGHEAQDALTFAAWGVD